MFWETALTLTRH